MRLAVPTIHVRVAMPTTRLWRVSSALELREQIEPPRLSSRVSRSTVKRDRDTLALRLPPELARTEEPGLLGVHVP